METIALESRSRTECIDITRQVQKTVSAARLASGVVVVYSAHTTAGLTINENADPDVIGDILATFEKLAPRQGAYAHSEGNADAHVKASLVGASVVVPVESGRLALGTWQGIYFCEFDGPRRRRVLVQLLPGAK